jgi:hypothetical protein
MILGVKGGRELYLRRHGVEINNKNTVRSFMKIVVVVKR